MSGHLVDESAKGVYIISATPFSHDGALDLESLDRLIGFYIEAGRPWHHDPWHDGRSPKADL